MRSAYIYLFLILLFPALSRAQQLPLSLPASIDYALRHQAGMKNAYLDEKIADARNKEVTGLVLPNISGNVSLNYAPLVAAFLVPNFIKTAIAGGGSIPGLVQGQYLDPSTVANTPDVLPLAFQPRWTTSPVVQLTQVVFDPAILVALNAKKELLHLAEENTRLTREDLIVAVKKAYFSVLVAQKQRDLLSSNIARIDRLERDTREIYNNGLAEKIDVDRVTVALNNLKTEELRANQLVQLAYMSLKFQMGMDLRTDIALTDSLSEQASTKELLNRTFNYTSRKEYELQLSQIRLSEYDVRRYKLGGIPTLALFANYGYTLYDAERLFDKNDTWQRAALIGVKLNVPIFDGLQRRNRLKQAEYTVQKNVNNLENLKYGLQLAQESARITLESNLRALNNQQSNLKLAEEVYNIAQVKYKEGVGSSLEVVDAETAYKEAQTNYFTALYDVVTSSVDLEKALGLID